MTLSLSREEVTNIDGIQYDDQNCKLPSEELDQDWKWPSEEEDDYEDIVITFPEDKEENAVMKDQVPLAVQKEKVSCTPYHGQYRPVFQFIPHIKGFGLVLNEHAKIAFSNDCYMEDGKFCGLRNDRVLGITRDGELAIEALIQHVGLQDSLELRIEIRDSVFHYNSHLWDGREYKRIPFAHEKPNLEREQEDIEMRASLIALMFYFDSHEYYRRRIEEIYKKAFDILVCRCMYYIARGIFSKKRASFRLPDCPHGINQLVINSNTRVVAGQFQLQASNIVVHDDSENKM